MTIISRIFYGVIAIGFIISIATAAFIYTKYGTIRLFLVQSGSMTPNIPVGSAIVVKQETKAVNILSPLPQSTLIPQYKEGGIVTFKSGKNIVTHRIVGIEERSGKFIYQTKGDANNAPDLGTISEKDILGEVAITLPYLGYLVAFAKTQKGYTVFIVIPITLIVYHELLNIKKELGGIFVKRSKGEFA